MDGGQKGWRGQTVWVCTGRLSARRSSAFVSHLRDGSRLQARAHERVKRNEDVRGGEMDMACGRKSVVECGWNVQTCGNPHGHLECGESADATAALFVRSNNLTPQETETPLRQP